MTQPTFWTTTTIHISPDHSRLIRLFSLCLLLACITPETTWAHATLISSSPTNGSSLAVSPTQIRLVFSEPLELSMCRVLLVEGRRTTELRVVADPRNVNALQANLETLSAGNHEVKWQVLSADGHPVSGVLRFSVGTAPPSTGNLDTTAPRATMPADREPKSRDVITGFAMLLRGIGLTALLALAGLLAFALRSEQDAARNYSPLATTLALLAAAGLLIHFVLWICHSFAVIGDADFFSILQTSAGKREAARTALAILALWAWGLARRRRLSFAFALAGIVASSLIGHAAAINPTASTAFKLIHLAAAATWLGGLAWILCLDAGKNEIFSREAKAVSSAAGWCAALVLISGIVQTGIILSWNTGGLKSPYAIVAELKLVGFAILVGMGAMNRFRILPILDTLVRSASLQRNVRREISIMVIVAMLGGVLGYLSPPESSIAAHPMEMRK